MPCSQLRSFRPIFLSLLLVSLSFIEQDSPSQNTASTKSADEAALRTLARDFYAAHAEANLERFSRLWSLKAPDLDSRMQSVLQSFATHDKIELKKLALRKILIASETARVRLEVQLAGTETKTGKPVFILNQAKRAIHCVKEDQVWKVWREIPAVEELVEALTAARTDPARWALLKEEEDLSTEEILKELERQGNYLSSQGNQSEALARFRLAQLISDRKKNQ